MKKLIGYYNYTVILTYIGFALGLVGIAAALCWGYTTFSVVCLLLAGLCDAFDGKIASTMKRTPEEKAFGIQIDSLCDLISFGVLPAAICYAEGAKGIICCIVLVQSGIFRSSDNVSINNIPYRISFGLYRFQ